MEDYFFILETLNGLVVIEYGLEAWLFLNLYCLLSQGDTLQDSGSLSIWMMEVIPSSI